MFLLHCTHQASPKKGEAVQVSEVVPADTICSLPAVHFSQCEASEGAKRQMERPGERLLHAWVQNCFLASFCLCVCLGTQPGSWDHCRMTLKRWQCRADMHPPAHTVWGLMLTSPGDFSCFSLALNTLFGIWSESEKVCTSFGGSEWTGKTDEFQHVLDFPSCFCLVTADPTGVEQSNPFTATAQIILFIYCFRVLPIHCELLNFLSFWKYRGVLYLLYSIWF